MIRERYTPMRVSEYDLVPLRITSRKSKKGRPWLRIPLLSRTTAIIRSSRVVKIGARTPKLSRSKNRRQQIVSIRLFWRCDVGGQEELVGSS